MNVLAVAAHPDDIDFTCGATVARLAEAGHSVTYCCVTNGQAGGSDYGLNRLEAAKVRRSEQKLAAANLGVKETIFLDRPDGQLEFNLELRRELTKVIRQTKPSLVIGPSPRHNFANVPFLHPDHLAVGHATLAAIYPDARNPFAFPELGIDPHSVSQLWLLEDPEPDYFVDISGYLELKLSALLEHSSQFATDLNLEEAVYSEAGRYAEMGGSIFLAAEAFKRVVYSDLTEVAF